MIFHFFAEYFRSWEKKKEGSIKSLKLYLIFVIVDSQWWLLALKEFEEIIGLIKVSFVECVMTYFIVFIDFLVEG